MMPASRNRKNTKRRVITADCETDPFKHKRVPQPFMWCAWDGERSEAHTFSTTQDFMDWVSQQNAYVYAHNGGKFDWDFLVNHILQYNDDARPKIVNGRIISCPFGKAVLKDSLAILPISLAQYKKDDIEMWKLEPENRLQYWREIESYCINDCKYLFELVTRFRQDAGTSDTIAANALAYSKKLDIDPGRTNYYFDRIMRPFYFGGRCEARQIGHFFDVRAFDIKSAYPYAMTFDHPSGDNYTEMGKFWKTLTRKQMQRALWHISCWSDQAFPIATENGLQFPQGYGEFYVTGWELVTAWDHDLVSDLTVHQCLKFKNTINFKPYVDHWFRHKQTAKESGDKAQEIIAKIMLNSLYGKLCENPTKYSEYVYVEADTPLPKSGEWLLYETGSVNDVWYKEPEHRMVEKHGKHWPSERLFRNTATGASITGFTRAMLLDAMHRVGRDNVLYMDTDSLVVKRAAQVDNLRRDGALGSWELEATATSAAIGGKKLYVLRLVNGPPKIACKGARPTARDIELAVDGYAIKWQNDAPTFKVSGKHTFMTRTIVRQDLRENHAGIRGTINHGSPDRRAEAAP